jgi:hypothetical protein
LRGQGRPPIFLKRIRSEKILPLQENRSGIFSQLFRFRKDIAEFKTLQDFLACPPTPFRERLASALLSTGTQQREPGHRFGSKEPWKHDGVTQLEGGNLEMDVQTYFQWWLDLSLNDFDLSIFTDPRVLSITSLLVFLLKAKIGLLKALAVSPMTILVEHTMFATLDVTGDSYVATLVFILVTALIASYLIYSLLIKDHSSCNEL